MRPKTRPAATYNLEQTMNKLFTCVAAVGCLLAFFSVAQARSIFGSSRDHIFVTQRGNCYAVYNFTVTIANGIVTYPNLVSLHGAFRRG
jgi:hypothetical protein